MTLKMYLLEANEILKQRKLIMKLKNKVKKLSTLAHQRSIIIILPSNDVKKLLKAASKFKNNEITSKFTRSFDKRLLPTI